MGTPEDYVNGIRLLLIGFCDQFRNMDIEQQNIPLWVKINKLPNYLRQSWLYVCSKLALSLKHCLFFHQPPNAHSIQWTYWIILLFFLLWRPFWNENIVNLCNWIHIHDNSSMNITKNGIWFLLWLFFFHQRKQWETSAYKDKFVAILPRDKKNAEFIMRSCMFTSHKAHIYFETLYRTHFKYDLLFSCQSTIGQWPNSHTWRIYKIYQDCLKWNFNLTNFLSKNDLKKLIIFPWHATFHACTR